LFSTDDHSHFSPNQKSELMCMVKLSSLVRAA
jgi:hypothetical protein